MNGDFLLVVGCGEDFFMYLYTIPTMNIKKTEAANQANKKRALQVGLPLLWLEVATIPLLRTALTGQ
jgi:hypothetical protein